jgi:hypothetical protein
MPVEDQEITIEITCTHLPGTQWEGRGPLYLGIQRGDEIREAAPADSKRAVFLPVLRVRKHTDGSANFLGPFAHGPRAGRFIYLNWVIQRDGVLVQMIGRVKLLLSHIDWPRVEKALAQKKTIKVTVPLTNAKGGPVFASVGPTLAKWAP